jgi:KUP system potassium uptake protein
MKNPRKHDRLAHSPKLDVMVLGAVGIVFGDIGTSPLYTLKTVLVLSGGKLDQTVVLGILSLLIWTLILVTSVKYVTVAMRIDNDGEGGILALMSLLGVKQRRRPVIVAVGLFGAALIYGDGAITPAISVLSALEGLNIAWPSFSSYVLPICVLILLLLFAVQSQGTAWIGKLFGPVMTVWFVAIGLLGLHGVLAHPSVLWAINPVHALRYLASSPGAFLVLGGVFLCVTGAEALYADMGHFGAKPIRIAWSGLVFPALVLSYAGQAALVLTGTNIADNIFFRLCPQALLIPMVLLSTIATIIASQSIITGAFSMTRQAIQLGWMPRMKIAQTSEQGYGQIYVAPVNWILMAVTISLAVWFGKSDNLAAAYGIAVSATMLMTSVLLYIAMRDVWHWPLAGAGAVALAFCTIDSAFFIANLQKIAEGGYVPLLLAGAVYGIMLIWHLGSEAVVARVQSSIMPIGEFVEQIKEHGVARVRGSAVFLTRTGRDAPPVMVWHVKHNRSLHEKILILTVVTESVPWTKSLDRLSIQEISPGFWRLTARFGFMERPNIPLLISQSKALGCDVDLSDVTYYVGHETIVPQKGHKGLPRFIEGIYAAMQRNCAQVTEYLRLPPDQVVEIGREIAI